MLPKLVLVMYMLVSPGRSSIQYVVHYDNEAHCSAEAAKYIQTNWQAYPVQRAECTFDLTKK